MLDEAVEKKFIYYADKEKVLESFPLELYFPKTFSFEDNKNILTKSDIVKRFLAQENRKSLGEENGFEMSL
jgi:hypothetical protein